LLKNYPNFHFLLQMLVRGGIFEPFVSVFEKFRGKNEVKMGRKAFFDDFFVEKRPKIWKIEENYLYLQRNNQNKHTKKTTCK